MLQIQNSYSPVSSLSCAAPEDHLSISGAAAPVTRMGKQVFHKYLHVLKGSLFVKFRDDWDAGGLARTSYLSLTTAIYPHYFDKIKSILYGNIPMNALEVSFFFYDAVCFFASLSLPSIIHGYVLLMSKVGPIRAGLLRSHIIMSSGRNRMDWSPGYLSPMSMCACVA